MAVEVEEAAHGIEVKIPVLGIGQFADLDQRLMKELVGVALQRGLDRTAVGLRQVGELPRPPVELLLAQFVRMLA